MKVNVLCYDRPLKGYVSGPVRKQFPITDCLGKHVATVKLSGDYENNNGLDEQFRHYEIRSNYVSPL